MIIDYLIWESYYKSHKGEDDAEEMKKIFDLYDKIIGIRLKVQKIIDLFQLFYTANNNIM